MRVSRLRASSHRGGTQLASAASAVPYERTFARFPSPSSSSSAAAGSCARAHALMAALTHATSGVTPYRLLMPWVRARAGFHSAASAHALTMFESTTMLGATPSASISAKSCRAASQWPRVAYACAVAPKVTAFGRRPSRRICARSAGERSAYEGRRAHAEIALVYEIVVGRIRSSSPVRIFSKSRRATSGWSARSHAESAPL